MEEGNNGNVEKFDIKLKSKPKDGIILQLHHTIRGSNGECRRIRFATAAFDDNNEILACVDNGGNLFILDFSDLKFWKLSGIGFATALYFIPTIQDTLIVATSKKYDICFLNIENGSISRELSGHTAPVKHISFSNHKICNLLTASPVEAILWELKNYTKFFTLNTYLGAQIQQIMFTPAGDHLVACFQNDTIQIWRHESMKSMKQIIPNDLSHMKSIAFTMNGRAMAMAGHTPTLILFSMDTWKAIKSLNLTKYNISGAQQIAFIPQVFDGGANKILAILSSDCILYFLDLEALTVVLTIYPDASGIKRFVVSPTGKYFLCILQLGEVNIYNASYVMELANKSKMEKIDQDIPSTSNHNTQQPQTSKAEVEQKMRICMDSARLRRILMQYGEYPDKFRTVIWRSLLNTPRNRIAYAALVEKGIHPAFRDIEKQFTIHSVAALKSLKRLLSCLAHWCPLFAVMKFLPGFIFPFVKVLQKDPLLLFECVATVLINYCQLWFEYAPFPPISILAMIENILAECDQSLLDHFCQLGITSQTYALKILETAFSEVLSCSEWLILWDHILSNEPSFILMAIVSYNVIQRNAIKKLKTHEELENFYHNQNPIDKKTFLKKTYLLLKETPEDIHPRRFFNPFVSLEKGDCYQQFSGYPKATICLKLERKDRKKHVKGKSPTLKNLTKISQEKNAQASPVSNESDIVSVCSDEESVEEYPSREDSARRHQKKKTSGNVHNTIKDELIDSVMISGLEEKLKHESETKCKKDPKHSPKSRSRRYRPDKKEILEKEVEKLLKSCTNSEHSDV